MPPKIRSSSQQKKQAESKRQARTEALDRSVRSAADARRAESSRSGNVIEGLWEAIPDFVKILAVVVVLGVFFVVIPLRRFQHQAYLDEGGRFGHNTTDTFHMVRLKDVDDTAVAMHKARRELRKKLVTTDLAIDELYDEDLIDGERTELLKQMLDNTADNFRLRDQIDFKDVSGVGGELLGMGFAYTLFDNLETSIRELIEKKEPIDIDAFEDFAEALDIV